MDSLEQSLYGSSPLPGLGELMSEQSGGEPLPVEEFEKFFRATIAYVDKAEQDRLWKQFVAVAEQPHEYLGVVYRSFFATLERTLGEWGYILTFDWKATTDVIPVAVRVAERIGLGDTFDWRGDGEPDPSMRDSTYHGPIHAFDWWLSERGYRVAKLDGGGDTIFMAVCPMGSLTNLVVQGRSLGSRVSFRQ